MHAHGYHLRPLKCAAIRVERTVALLLVQAEGWVLTRVQLLQQLWPNSVVEEGEPELAHFRAAHRVVTA